MAAICFAGLGVQGRTGNQLWQYASMLGISDRMGVKLNLPPWRYAKYFKGKFPEGPQRGAIIPEPAFHYCPGFVPNDGKDYGVFGNLQSEKYFGHIKDYVKQQLEWEPGFLAGVLAKNRHLLGENTIAVHIRRGDYVGNINYVNLPPTYYILALYEHFPDWKQRKLLFFSDDPAYCRIHFGCLENAFFSEGNSDIEDLCLMSRCKDFLIANSSFSWWGSFLGEKEGTKIVHPARNFAGPLLAVSDTKDLYPDRWTAFDHLDKRIPLKDMTFTIPASFDHPDRKQNMDLTVCMLQRDFDTNISVMEQGGGRFSYMAQWCRYSKFTGHVFHRTRMLNMMAREADTPFVANYDCDVLFPPMQVLLAVEKLRAGVDVVSPFMGWFAGVPRVPWFKMLEKHLDVGIFGATKFRGKGINPGSEDAMGGAVFVNKKSFLEVGGENENYVGWGNEDNERWWRFGKLGLKLERIVGFLYHIDHFRGVNSGGNHPNHAGNTVEWNKISQMDKNQLTEYIKTWSK